MDNFADRLIKAIRQKQSCVIVGLDPRLELIPKSLFAIRRSVSADSQKQTRLTARQVANVIVRFNKVIIDIVADSVVGVKPQSAFYEKFGWWGVRAFWETLAYAKRKGLITIADVKRGDVPATAQAYAEAYLGKSQIPNPKSQINPIDAVTINPFMGEDSIEPFIKLAKQNGKGLFVLVKTSNTGSKDFQDKVLSNGKRLCDFLAEKVKQWGKELIGKNGYSSLGAVVGATFPKQARILRKLMPEQFFLVPGYGVQGGKAKDIRFCFNKDGLGAVVTASRSIIHSYQDPSRKDWRKAVRAAVIKMKQATQGFD